MTRLLQQKPHPRAPRTIVDAHGKSHVFKHRPFVTLYRQILGGFK